MTQMTPERRAELAARCGVGDDYMYQVITGRKRPSPELCIVIERESSRAITCEELRPDVDWGYLRATNCPSAQQDTAHV